MLKIILTLVTLLAGDLLSHQSAAAEEFSMVSERATRSYQDMLEGRGDIAVANLTITPERQEVVDFSMPLLKNVRELVITGVDVKPMSSINELSGMSVHVRKSSSYHSSLLKANVKLQGWACPRAPLPARRGDSHFYTLDGDDHVCSAAVSSALGQAF
jgi:hypothetical protein